METKKILQPVLILSKIFTMSLVKIKTEAENSATIKLVKNKRYVFYYLRLVVLLSAIIFCVIFRQYQKSIYDTTGVITVSVQFAHYNCRIPIAILCLWMTNYKCKVVVKFLNDFVDMDGKFRHIHQQVHYKNTKRFSYAVLALMVVKVLVQHLPYLVGGFKWNLIDFLDYIIYNLPLILIHVLTTQWIIFLYLLRTYFITLNQYLKTLKYNQCFVVQDYVKMYSTKNSSFGVTPKYSPMEVLRHASVIYDNLCLQSERINGAFAWQILGIVPSLFILIIFSSFNVCQMIKDKMEFDEKTVIFNLLYFLSFLELVMPCVYVKEEADKFVDILHRVDVNFDGNQDMDDMMNSITLQTYHQKIEFSALGVFPLDGTLIYSVFYNNNAL